MDEEVLVAMRDLGRGPSDQEPRRQTDARDQNPPRKVACRSDRHAGGKQARRSLVDLRFFEPGATGHGESVQRVLQVLVQTSTQRLRTAAYVGSALHSPEAEDRQERHLRPAR